MDSPKNSHIQAWRPGNYSAFPLKLLVACVGMAGYLDFLVSGGFSSLSKTLSSMCIMPPASRQVQVMENIHG